MSFISKIALRSFLIAGLLALGASARADVSQGRVETPARVALGDTATVTELFACPSTCTPDSLAQTIEIYLQQSIMRDGLQNATVNVQVDGGQYYAVLNGVPAGYPERVTQFLSIGSLGKTARDKLQQDGKWNAAQWRFFLPLGLPLTNQKSAQLLHFPPDYSLTERNYLGSKTSQRWETLLELNGAPSASIAVYERIVDIAPVAAPADAGGSLAETYAYFKDYAYAMLNYSVSPPPAKLPLPVVAYGGPVRAWVKTYLGGDLKVSASPAYLQVGNVEHIPFLGANHPSLFWYAAKDSRTQALRVMRDDLVAACWQVKMGEDPQRDINSTLDGCSTYWDRRDTEVCEQTEIQGYNKTPEEARKLCARSARKLMKAARALREEDMAHIERNMPSEPRHP